MEGSEGKEREFIWLQSAGIVTLDVYGTDGLSMKKPSEHYLILSGQFV